MTFRLPPEARTGGHPYRRSMHSTALIEPHSLAVETHGLGKRFGTRAALDGVDLEVPCGCAFGFLGANGAGKTTLIRLLLGLAEPTAGRMRLLGRDLPAQRAAALARVGAIIEEPRFHPHLTGRENLDVHAAARERSAHERIDGALARVGLAARGDDRVKTTRSACASASVLRAACWPTRSTEDILGLSMLASFAAGFGLYIGNRRTSMEALRERAERLDRERELLAERAVAEERVRIAQELHDVVAHNVSLIVVQAQALGATVPDQCVAEATAGIADLGRRAMAEMHRTLTITDRGDAGLSANAGAGSAGGHGLVGMRERAAIFGGTLTAGARSDNGFEVRALIPYGEGSLT